MHKQLFLFFSIVLLIGTGCKRDPFPKPKPELKEDLQGIINKNLALYKAKFPGKEIGLGLYVKEAWRGGHGLSNQDIYVSSGFPESYGADIQFRGASTTKSFTAAAILKLHQQNKLNIDDLITDNIPGTNQPYIPATPEFAIPYKEKITIRLLLQHRAGVFDVTNDAIPSSANVPYHGIKYTDHILQQDDNHTFTIPELMSVVAINKLSYFKPGKAFHYSNGGYHLLGEIIERVSGMRYHEYLQDAFLTPLQMTHTHFPYLGTDQAMPSPHVTSWLKQGNDFSEWDNDNISHAVADGNIITTPADLATWANALYATNTILNADLHAQMITGVPTKEEHVIYGLGTELNPPDLGYGHNGAHPAYMTIMRYNPETKASYVLFANFLDATSMDALNKQGAGLANIVREAIGAVKAAQ